MCADADRALGRRNSGAVPERQLAGTSRGTAASSVRV